MALEGEYRISVGLEDVPVRPGSILARLTQAEENPLAEIFKKPVQDNSVVDVGRIPSPDDLAKASGRGIKIETITIRMRDAEDQKTSEKRQRLEACRNNITNKQERLSALMMPLVLYLAAARLVSNMRGGHIIQKRLDLLKRLSEGLSQLAKVIGEMLRQIVAPMKTMTMLVLTGLNGANGDASQTVMIKTSEEKTDTTNNSGGEGDVGSLIGGDSDGMSVSDLLQKPDAVTDKIDKHLERSDKAFNSLGACVSTHLELVLKRDKMFEKLEQVQHQLQAKAHKNASASAKVALAVAKVYQAIQTMDELLEESEPHLEAMVEHTLSGAATSIASTALQDASTAIDVKQPGEQQQPEAESPADKEVNYLVEQSHNRYDRHQENLAEVDKAFEVIDQYANGSEPDKNNKKSDETKEPEKLNGLQIKLDVPKDQAVFLQIRQPEGGKTILPGLLGKPPAKASV